jgi:hypothetical protein
MLLDGGHDATLLRQGCHNERKLFENSLADILLRSALTLAEQILPATLQVPEEILRLYWSRISKGDSLIRRKIHPRQSNLPD